MTLFVFIQFQLQKKWKENTMGCNLYAAPGVCMFLPQSVYSRMNEHILYSKSWATFFIIAHYNHKYKNVRTMQYAMHTMYVYYKLRASTRRICSHRTVYITIIHSQRYSYCSFDDFLFYISATATEIDVYRCAIIYKSNVCIFSLISLFLIRCVYESARARARDILRSKFLTWI